MTLGFHVIVARLVCLDLNNFIFIADVEFLATGCCFFVTISEQTDAEP